MDVKIQDIRKSYKDRDILKGVSFEIQKGTYVDCLVSTVLGNQR